MDLKKAQQLDKKHIFPTYRRLPLLIVRGKGSYLFDSSGNRYLDLTAGWGVSALGHSNPRVVAAISKQAAGLQHVSNLFLTKPMLPAAEKLTKLSGMSKVFFANSGAEANEAAYKLVRKHSNEKYGPGRTDIIAFKQSFHGRTLANVAATGQAVYRKGFAPLPGGFRHATFNDLKSVKKAITKKTCAILVEPVQGEGGVYVAERDFIRGLDELRRKKDIKLIFDEVQCGLCRTGKWFAHQHYGVKPDVLTLAKALGGGLPIGAMLARGEAAKAFAAGNHASTFGANPVACAAACAVLGEMEKRQLAQRAAKLGGATIKKLRALQKKYPAIREVRGRGMMIAVEIDGDSNEAALFFLDRGILVNSIHGNILRILPPLTVAERELARLIKTLEEYLKKVGSR